MSNRVTLEQLVNLPIGEVASLPVEQIAMLAEDLAGEEARVKLMKEWLSGAMNLRWGQAAADARQAAGTTAGTVRLPESDGFVVVASAAKKVEWNQDGLATAVDVVKSWGDDPDEYVTTEFKVEEKKYNAWPSKLRALFEPARTVSAGRSTFVIERADAKAKKPGRRDA